MIIPVILFLSGVVRMTCFQAFTAGIERDGKASEKYKFARCVKKRVGKLRTSPITIDFMYVVLFLLNLLLLLLSLFRFSL